MTCRYHLLALAIVILVPMARAQPGTLDPDFGTDGIRILAPSMWSDEGVEVLHLADTTLLVCGITTVNGARTGFITHILQDGTVDTSYGMNNGYTFFGTAPESFTSDMEFANDGSVYVCGMAYPAFNLYVPWVAHILADGSLDPAFGMAGVAFPSNANQDVMIIDMAVQLDGNIVLSGSIGLNADSDALLMRMTPSGGMDSTFNADGTLQLTHYAGSDRLAGVDLLDDGSIIGVGWAAVNGLSQTICVKADATGTLVGSFDGDGILEPGLPFTNDQASAVKCSGQQFYVGGADMSNSSDVNVYVARLNNDGSFDAAYGSAGVTTTDLDNVEGINDLRIQSDGKLLASGFTGPLGGPLGTWDALVLRFDVAGTPDAAFGTGGAVTTGISPGKDTANGMTVQADGKIVCVGSTPNINAMDAFILRFTNDLGTGLPAPSAHNGLIVHPVPVAAGGTITVSGASTSGPFHCWDGCGRVVELTSTRYTADQLTFGTANLEPGVYLLRVGERCVRFVVGR